MDFFNTLLSELSKKNFEKWVDSFNELSLLYIFFPLFIIELIRYKFQKKLNWSVLADSFSSGVILMTFTFTEYVLNLLFVTKLYFGVHEHLTLIDMPFSLAGVVHGLVILDFAYYWKHRIMHRMGLGWATHSVHHSSVFFNLSVSCRLGPLDVFFSMPFALLVIALGFHPLLVIFYNILSKFYQTTIHTEIIGRLPKLIEFVFNTPSHHRVHHASNRQYFDKNYGGILIIWDRILGTFASEGGKISYGISNAAPTNNPITVFTQGGYKLYTEIKNTKGFINKYLLLIKPPGWKPN